MKNNNTLDDKELQRYSRHLLMSEFDVKGQLALKHATVLIVGLGGLGSPVAMYLAAAGIGRCILVDDDYVELSNLQRQIIHNEERLNQAKVLSAKQSIAQLNSAVECITFCERLDDEALRKNIVAADVVIDCSDNFPTRQKINALCVQEKTALVSGAAIRLEGQISVFDLRQDNSPCYACLYDIVDDENLSCSQSGVLSPLVGIVGSYQALEAIKLLSGLGQCLVGRLQIFDAKTSAWREFLLHKDPECKVCS